MDLSARTWLHRNTRNRTCSVPEDEAVTLTSLEEGERGEPVPAVGAELDELAPG